MENINTKLKKQSAHKENHQSPQFFIEEKLENVIKQWESYKSNKLVLVPTRKKASSSHNLALSPKEPNSPGLIFPKTQPLQRKLSVIHTNGLLEKLEKVKSNLASGILRRK